VSMKPQDTIDFLQGYHARRGDLFDLKEVEGTFVVTVKRASGGTVHLTLTPRDTNLLVHIEGDCSDFVACYSPQESLTLALDLIERTRAERSRADG